MFIIVPADALARNVARPSAGTVLSEYLDMFSLNYKLSLSHFRCSHQRDLLLVTNWHPHALRCQEAGGADRQNRQARCWCRNIHCQARTIRWKIYGVYGWNSCVESIPLLFVFHHVASCQLCPGLWKKSPVLLKGHHVANLLANGNAAFIWKLCFHWLWGAITSIYPMAAQLSNESCAAIE